MSYKTLVVILVAFSLVVSNLGLTKLIEFSIPLLTAIYPPCIVLVLLSFFKGLWYVQARIVRPVVLVSLIFGSIDALKDTGFGDFTSGVSTNIPFGNQGLAWLAPCLITLVGAFICDRVLGKRQEIVA